MHPPTGNPGYVPGVSRKQNRFPCVICMALNLVAKYENSLSDYSDSSQMPCILQLCRSTNTESYGGDGGGV